MSSVYIKKIKVTNLFGTINYDIDLSVGEPTAIIIAPNGMGKTTILNLISHVFDPSDESFEMIQEVPFEKFSCELSNGIDINFIRTKTEGNINEGSIVIDESDMSIEPIGALLIGANFKFEICRKRKSIVSFDYFERMSKNNQFDRLERERIIKYLAEEIELYDNHHKRAEEKYSRIWEKQKEGLKKTGCNIEISFIRADRIQPIIEFDSRSRRSRRERPLQMSALEAASGYIASVVTNATDTYNDKVSDAKDRLPALFLGDHTDVLPFEEFDERWRKYTDELHEFQEVGLIQPDKAPLIDKLAENDYESNPDKKKFLSVYIDAFENTTAPLKEVYGRLNLFKKIFEDRNAITGKKISFDRRGVQIESSGQGLALDKLSSGEQHDFIMFYDLIFQTPKNALVLIDEPEISLHIEWQETFLNRLIEICKMNDLHAIIATHSPNIVNSHYDCIVDKGETNG